MERENFELLADATAERSVLGACLLEREIPQNLEGLLAPRDFYYLQNGEIFAVMEKLKERQALIDLTSLGDELRRTDKLDRIGGVLYLTSLLEGTATAANAVYHAKIVLDFSLRRQLQSAAREIISASGNLTKTEVELRDYAENKITSLRAHREKLLLLRECLEDACARIDENKPFIYSGYADFDKIIGGFLPQDYVLLAARPSMGKTAWILNMGERMAEAGNTIHIVSLEMSKEMLAERMLVADSGVHIGRYRKAALAPEEYDALFRSKEKLSRLPIHVCDNAGVDIFELKHLIRRSILPTRRNVVIIDYLQLIQSPPKENRQQEITFISGHLKSLAKETNAVLIVLSQLSRAVEGRGVHRPQLSDLRESGSLEQDADEVVFIYRPEYYKIFEQKTREGVMDLRGLAEIIVAKHRNGKTGECWLTFRADRARFDDRSYF